MNLANISPKVKTKVETLLSKIDLNQPILGGVNAITGRAYKGNNALWTGAAQENNGFVTPLWMTYSQATAVGAKVKKGSKGCPIMFFREKEEKDEKGRNKKIISYSTVFNVDQIDFDNADEDFELPKDWKQEQWQQEKEEEEIKGKQEPKSKVLSFAEGLKIRQEKARITVLEEQLEIEIARIFDLIDLKAKETKAINEYLDVMQIAAQKIRDLGGYAGVDRHDRSHDIRALTDVLNSCHFLAMGAKIKILKDLGIDHQTYGGHISEANHVRNSEFNFAKNAIKLRELIQYSSPALMSMETSKKLEHMQSGGRPKISSHTMHSLDDLHILSAWRQGKVITEELSLKRLNEEQYRLAQRGEAFLIESPFLRVRGYKNGRLHIKFK